MSGPPSSHNQRQGHRPTASGYEQAVRGEGYTVPYQSPPKAPPQTGLGRRIRQYRDLRQRARANSMSWWGAKALQGMLIGIIPVTFGLLLTAAYALVGGSVFWALLGLLLLLGGVAAILWYALAPWTCKWIVTVPENCYWVVEDANGHTAEYLPPGRLIVPFRMNSKVRDYVDFNAITIRETYEDVLRGSGRKVDLEINVVAAFNPVEADPRLYARLRTMIVREQFEDIVTNHVRDAVSMYFTRLSPDFWQGALQNPKVLEETIIDQLYGLEAMGLFLGSSQPVTVFVHGITISSAGSASMPLAPDPFDPLGSATYRAQTSRSARPLPEQHFDQDYTIRRPVEREPSFDDQVTMPHLQPARDGHSGYEPQPSVDDLDVTMPHGRTPAFVPGTIGTTTGNDDTNIETLLQQVQDTEPPRDERRAKQSDKPQPKTAPPDLWLGRRKDQD